VISRESTKKIMRNKFACLLALLIVPASVCVSAPADKTSKPAPAKAAPAAAKPATPAPVRPTPAANTSTPSGGRNNNNTSTPSGGRNNNNSSTPSGGRNNNNSSTPSGGRTNNASAPSGGVTGGRNTNNASTPSGGVSGGRTNNASTPSGGVPGGRSNNNAATPSGGVPGGRSNNNAATPSGGATGGRTFGNAGVPGRGGVAGNNPTPPSRQPPVFRPGPNMQTTRRPDGTQVHVNPQTHATINTDRGGHITSFERPGVKATGFRTDGRAGHIEQSRPDGSRMVVDRGVHGERTVQSVRPGGVRVVSVGRQGFVERPFRPGYVSRTYVVGGRTQVRVYRSYTYRNVQYVTYVPSVYYQPAFYSWAYRPWNRPVVFAWGWGSAPWYGYYGGYFAPAPMYPTASLWLTDYLLAQNLQAAYAYQTAPGGDISTEPVAQNSQGALSPEVKQMIADEVQQQLAAQQAAAAQPAATAAYQPTAADTPPPALDPSLRIFVVSTPLNVTGTADGQTCGLTPGDVIERASRTVTSNGMVAINVINSKAGDCPVDTASSLDVATLQDMHNQFQEQIANGMNQLASNPGQGGLPAAPAANPQPVAAGQAPADPQAATLLAQQTQQADQTEADIQSSAASGQ